MDKKVILRYLICYKNDLFLNEWQNSFYCRKDYNPNYIFSGKLGFYFEKNVFLYPFMKDVFFFFFPVILLVYNLYLFLSYLFNLLISKKKEIAFDKLFIHTSKSIVKTVKRINFFSDSDYILMFPYKISTAIPKQQQLKIYDFLNFRILFKSYLYTFYFFYIVIRKFSYSKSFYLIQCFKWLILYFSLSNIELDKEIIMSNQIDRWAFLLDSLPHKKKTIIQHGTILYKMTPNEYNLHFLKYDNNDNVYYLILPIRLSSIKNILCFTDLEAKYMLKGLFHCNPSVKLIGYGLTLDKRMDSYKSVLIVGNIIEYLRQEELLLAELQKYNIIIYVKTHPLISIDKYNYLLKKYRFKLLSGNHYPTVDIVFSYASTLALEYESLGIPVVYYSQIFDNNLIIDRKIINQYM